MASKEFKVIDKTGLEPLWDKVNELHTTLQTCFNDYSESNSSINGAILTKVNGEISNFDFIEQIKLALPH